MKTILIWVVVLLILLDSHIQHFLPIEKNLISEVMFLIFAGFFVVQSILRNRMDILSLLILLLITSSFLIGLFNNGLLISLIGSVFLFKFLFAFLAGKYLDIRAGKLQNLMKFIYFLAILSMALTISQFTFNNTWIDNPFGFNTKDTTRFIIGLFDNRNKNAQLIILGYIFGVILYPMKSLPLHLLRLAIFLTVIFLTGSRQGLISFLIVETFILYILKPKKVFGAYILIIISLSTVFVITNFQLFQQKFHEIDNVLKGEYFRVQAVIKSYEVFKDYPAFGLGPGTFGGPVANFTNSTYHDRYDLFVYWGNYSKNVPRTMDTYWPHMLAEIGLMGLVLTGIVIFYIMKKISLKASKTHDKLILLNVAIISTLFFSFFSMNLETIHTAQIIFFISGIFIASSND